MVLTKKDMYWLRKEKGDTGIYEKQNRTEAKYRFNLVDN